MTNSGKAYYNKNKEKISKYKKRNSKQIEENRKKYRNQNRDKIRKTQYIYNKNKLLYDINFRLRNTIKSRINKALKGRNKSESTMCLLGCSIDYLMYYIQCRFKKGMSWDNHGRGDGDKGMKEWHMDQIKPCALFDLSTPEELSECFHYSNLQPLWAKDNIKKSNNYEEKPC